MKKYIAAGAVAIMVFAFSAFAAQLNVDGRVLQAGVDTHLACFTDAELSYATGYAQNTSHTVGGVAQDPAEPFHVVSITVNLSGGHADCMDDDLRGHLKVNDGDQNPIGPHGYAIVPMAQDPAAGTATFTVKANKNALLVSRLNQVQVMVNTFTNIHEQAGWGSGVFSTGGGALVP
jgi:hypothetical protein